MTLPVVFSHSARGQLRELFAYIAEANSPQVAENYVAAIMGFCHGLGTAPLARGRARDDLRPGMRTVGFRRRVVVAFAVTTARVEIIGVFYGGRDYETALRR